MIRRCRPGLDNRAIFRMVVLELLPQTRRAFPHLRLDRKQVQARLKRATTFVAVRGKRPPSGFIAVVPRRELLYIDMLAVKRSEQGAGLGSGLIRRAEQYGARCGCREAFLYVDEGNEGAKRFYASNGFVEIRYIPRIKCYLYAKSLEGGGSAESF